jgi:hypothetical protein
MALFPLAASSVTTRREMTVFNNQTVSRIEGTANTLLQRMTDGKYFPSNRANYLTTFSYNILALSSALETKEK